MLFRSYLSADQTITGEDTFIGYAYVGPLGAGQEAQVEIPASFPGGLTGPYYLGAIADVWGNVAESNEANNAAAGNQITRTQPVTLTANAGVDQILECPANPTPSVTLDGAASSGLGGGELTYLWTWTDGASTYHATGATPSVVLPRWGTYAVALDVGDTSGHTSTDIVNVTAGDTIAPRTTASVVGTRNADGVYTSAVIVNLTSRDACTGVKEIHYTVDGTPHVLTFEPTPVASTSFTVSENGEHVITFWSVDAAGRASSPVSPPPIHVDPPTTPPPGGGTSCVNVTLVSDGSGQVMYSLDGVNWQPYSSSTGLNLCGGDSTAVSYGYSEPNANVEPVQTLIIVIDTGYAIAPTVSGLMDLVRHYRTTGDITDQVTADNLLAALQSALIAPSEKDQDNALKAFMNKVEAQTGKKISAVASRVLLEATIYVIGHN